MEENNNPSEIQGGQEPKTLDVFQAINIASEKGSKDVASDVYYNRDKHNVELSLDSKEKTYGDFREKYKDQYESGGDDVSKKLDKAFEQRYSYAEKLYNNSEKVKVISDGWITSSGKTTNVVSSDVFDFEEDKYKTNTTWGGNKIRTDQQSASNKGYGYSKDGEKISVEALKKRADENDTKLVVDFDRDKGGYMWREVSDSVLTGEESVWSEVFDDKKLRNEGFSDYLKDFYSGLVGGTLSTIGYLKKLDEEYLGDALTSTILTVPTLGMSMVHHYAKPFMDNDEQEKSVKNAKLKIEGLQKKLGEQGLSNEDTASIYSEINKLSDEVANSQYIISSNDILSNADIMSKRLSEIDSRSGWSGGSLSRMGGELIPQIVLGFLSGGTSVIGTTAAQGAKQGAVALTKKIVKNSLKKMATGLKNPGLLYGSLQAGKGAFDGALQAGMTEEQALNYSLPTMLYAQVAQSMIGVGKQYGNKSIDKAMGNNFKTAITKELQPLMKEMAEKGLSDTAIKQGIAKGTIGAIGKTVNTISKALKYADDKVPVLAGFREEAAEETLEEYLNILSERFYNEYMSEESGARFEEGDIWGRLKDTYLLGGIGGSYMNVASTSMRNLVTKRGSRVNPFWNKNTSFNPKEDMKDFEDHLMEAVLQGKEADLMKDVEKVYASNNWNNLNVDGSVRKSDSQEVSLGEQSKQEVLAQIGQLVKLRNELKIDDPKNKVFNNFAGNKISLAKDLLTESLRKSEAQNELKALQESLATETNDEVKSEKSKQVQELEDVISNHDANIDRVQSGKLNKSLVREAVLNANGLSEDSMVGKVLESDTPSDLFLEAQRVKDKEDYKAYAQVVKANNEKVAKKNEKVKPDRETSISAEASAVNDLKSLLGNKNIDVTQKAEKTLETLKKFQGGYNAENMGLLKSLRDDIAASVSDLDVDEFYDALGEFDAKTLDYKFDNEEDLIDYDDFVKNKSRRFIDSETGKAMSMNDFIQEINNTEEKDIMQRKNVTDRIDELKKIKREFDMRRSISDLAPEYKERKNINYKDEEGNEIDLDKDISHYEGLSEAEAKEFRDEIDKTIAELENITWDENIRELEKISKSQDIVSVKIYAISKVHDLFSDPEVKEAAKEALDLLDELYDITDEEKGDIDIDAFDKKFLEVEKALNKVEDGIYKELSDSGKLDKYNQRLDSFFNKELLDNGDKIIDSENKKAKGLRIERINYLSSLSQINGSTFRTVLNNSLSKGEKLPPTHEGIYSLRTLIGNQLDNRKKPKYLNVHRKGKKGTHTNNISFVQGYAGAGKTTLFPNVYIGMMKELNPNSSTILLAPNDSIKAEITGKLTEENNHLGSDSFKSIFKRDSRGVATVDMDKLNLLFKDADENTTFFVDEMTLLSRDYYQAFLGAVRNQPFNVVLMGDQGQYQMSTSEGDANVKLSANTNPVNELSIVFRTGVKNIWNAQSVYRKKTLENVGNYDTVMPKTYYNENRTKGLKQVGNVSIEEFLEDYINDHKNIKGRSHNSKIYVKNESDYKRALQVLTDNKIENAADQIKVLNFDSKNSGIGLSYDNIYVAIEHSPDINNNKAVLTALTRAKGYVSMISKEANSSQAEESMIESVEALSKEDIDNEMDKVVSFNDEIINADEVQEGLVKAKYTQGKKETSENDEDEEIVTPPVPDNDDKTTKEGSEKMEKDLFWVKNQSEKGTSFTYSGIETGVKKDSLLDLSKDEVTFNKKGEVKDAKVLRWSDPKGNIVHSIAVKVKGKMKIISNLSFTYKTNGKDTVTFLREKYPSADEELIQEYASKIDKSNEKIKAIENATATEVDGEFEVVDLAVSLTKDDFKTKFIKSKGSNDVSLDEIISRGNTNNDKAFNVVGIREDDGVAFQVTINGRKWLMNARKVVQEDKGKVVDNFLDGGFIKNNPFVYTNKHALLKLSEIFESDNEGRIQIKGQTQENPSLSQEQRHLVRTHLMDANTKIYYPVNTLGKDLSDNVDPKSYKNLITRTSATSKPLESVGLMAEPLIEGRGKPIVKGKLVKDDKEITASGTKRKGKRGGMMKSGKSVNNDYYEKIDKALDYFTKVFGEEFVYNNFNFEEDLTVDGQKLWGMVKGQLLTLDSRNGLTASRAKRHEALHYVLENFLDENERRSILDEAKKSMVEDIDSPYNEVSKVSDLEAEEFLAEKYPNKYDKDSTSRIGRIINWIKDLVFNTLDKMYNRPSDFKNILRRIESGYFNNAALKDSGSDGSSKFSIKTADLEMLQGLMENHEDYDESTVDLKKSEDVSEINNAWKSLIDNLGSQAGFALNFFSVNYKNYSLLAKEYLMQDSSEGLFHANSLLRDEHNLHALAENMADDLKNSIDNFDEVLARAERKVQIGEGLTIDETKAMVANPEMIKNLRRASDGTTDKQEIAKSKSDAGARFGIDSTQTNWEGKVSQRLKSIFYMIKPYNPSGYNNMYTSPKDVEKATQVYSKLVSDGVHKESEAFIDNYLNNMHPKDAHYARELINLLWRNESFAGSLIDYSIDEESEELFELFFNEDMSMSEMILNSDNIIEELENIKKNEKFDNKKDIDIAIKTVKAKVREYQNVLNGLEHQLGSLSLDERVNYKDTSYGEHKKTEVVSGFVADQRELLDQTKETIRNRSPYSKKNNVFNHLDSPYQVRFEGEKTNSTIYVVQNDGSKAVKLFAFDKEAGRYRWNKDADHNTKYEMVNAIFTELGLNHVPADFKLKMVRHTESGFEKGVDGKSPNQNTENKISGMIYSTLFQQYNHAIDESLKPNFDGKGYLANKLKDFHAYNLIGKYEGSVESEEVHIGEGHVEMIDKMLEPDQNRYHTLWDDLASNEYENPDFSRSHIAYTADGEKQYLNTPKNFISRKAKDLRRKVRFVQGLKNNFKALKGKKLSGVTQNDWLRMTTGAQLRNIANGKDVYVPLMLTGDRGTMPEIQIMESEFGFIPGSLKFDYQKWGEKYLSMANDLKEKYNESLKAFDRVKADFAESYSGLTEEEIEAIPSEVMNEARIKHYRKSNLVENRDFKVNRDGSVTTGRLVELYEGKGFVNRNVANEIANGKDVEQVVRGFYNDHIYNLRTQMKSADIKSYVKGFDYDSNDKTKKKFELETFETPTGFNSKWVEKEYKTSAPSDALVGWYIGSSLAMNEAQGELIGSEHNFKNMEDMVKRAAVVASPMQSYPEYNTVTNRGFWQNINIAIVDNLGDLMTGGGNRGTSSDMFDGASFTTFAHDQMVSETHGGNYANAPLSDGMEKTVGYAYEGGETTVLKHAEVRINHDIYLTNKAYFDKINKLSVEGDFSEEYDELFDAELNPAILTEAGFQKAKRQWLNLIMEEDVEFVSVIAPPDSIKVGLTNTNYIEDIEGTEGYIKSTHIPVGSYGKQLETHQDPDSTASGDTQVSDVIAINSANTELVAEEKAIKEKMLEDAIDNIISENPSSQDLKGWLTDNASKRSTMSKEIELLFNDESSIQDPSLQRLLRDAIAARLKSKGFSPRLNGYRVNQAPGNFLKMVQAEMDDGSVIEMLKSTAIKEGFKIVNDSERELSLVRNEETNVVEAELVMSSRAFYKFKNLLLNSDNESLKELGSRFDNMSISHIKRALELYDKEEGTNKLESFNEALNTYQFRIPSSNTSFGFVGKVVGFANISSNTLYIPSAINEYTGGDYDIDQLTIFLKELDDNADMVEDSYTNKIMNLRERFFKDARNSEQNEIKIDLGTLKKRLVEAVGGGMTKEVMNGIEYITSMFRNIQDGVQGTGIFANSIKIYSNLMAAKNLNKGVKFGTLVDDLSIYNKNGEGDNNWIIGYFNDFLNAALDNAKELILGIANVNPETMNLISSMGVDGLTPVEAVKLLNGMSVELNDSNGYWTKHDKLGSKVFKNLAKMNSYGVDASKKIDPAYLMDLLSNEVIGDDYVKNMTNHLKKVGIQFENMTVEQATDIQVWASQMYKYYVDAEALNNVNFLAKMNTKGMDLSLKNLSDFEKFKNMSSKSYRDTLYKEKKAKLEENQDISGLRNLDFQKKKEDEVYERISVANLMNEYSTFKSYDDTYKKSKGYLGNMLLRNKPEWIGTIERVAKKFGFLNNIPEDFVNKANFAMENVLIAQFLNAHKSNYNFNGSDYNLNSSMGRTQFMLDVTEKIDEAKSSINNKFLNMIVTDIDSDKLLPSVSIMNAARVSDENAAMIRAGFTELKHNEDTKGLYDAIQMFSMLKSGFSHNRYSLSNFTTDDLRIEYNRYLESLSKNEVYNDAGGNTIFDLNDSEMEGVVTSYLSDKLPYNNGKRKMGTVKNSDISEIVKEKGDVIHSRSQSFMMHSSVFDHNPVTIGNQELFIDVNTHTFVPTNLDMYNKIKNGATRVDINTNNSTKKFLDKDGEKKIVRLKDGNDYRIVNSTIDNQKMLTLEKINC